MPWPLGICPRCIIRRDSYFIFLIIIFLILPLHPTMHSASLASVTWEAAIFLCFPKFLPERDCVTSDPDAYGKLCVSAQ